MAQVTLLSLYDHITVYHRVCMGAYDFNLHGPAMCTSALLCVIASFMNFD